jgi:hypothetical protein
LLNLGRNYYSLDIPVTYTYFNPKSGIDISLTAGLMVNWRNPDRLSHRQRVSCGLAGRECRTIGTGERFDQHLTPRQDSLVREILGWTLERLQI